MLNTLVHDKPVSVGSQWALYNPTHEYGPLQALESNFIFRMGLLHYPLYTYQPSTPNE